VPVNIEVDGLIRALRETDPYIETIYKCGGCYKFHLFLKKLWPNSIAVRNDDFDHVGTLIDGVCYDISGYANWNWHVMSKEEEADAMKWGFVNQNMLSIGECPICEEPLLV